MKNLHIGGLIAAGFDPSGVYLLTVSHDGRGVFDLRSWDRVARDSSLAYPENGTAIGIGPIEGMRISVTEMNYETGDLRFTSPDGKYTFEYESGHVYVSNTQAQQDSGGNGGQGR